jgi:predicted alpha/beta-fold hydrolase
LTPLRPFIPHPWTIGGHRQTLLGFWRRRWMRWPLPVEDRVVALAEDVRLLVRASWQPGPRFARPAVVLVHGLGGSDGASYMLATGRLAWGLGWHVVRMNLRGAGDSEALCPRLYNAGLAGDVVGVLADTAREAAWIGVVGFSLGASVSLLAFAQCEARLPPAVSGLVAISAPLDLARCAGALELPQNRLYQDYFMVMLRGAYRRLRERRPDLYERGRERGARTVRQYDEAITAPYGGYSSAAQYYSSCSAGPRLASVQRPTLLLSAWDDPMVPGDSIAQWPLAGSTMSREILPTGGHVGFVAPTAAPGHFWAAERAMAFLTAESADARAT